MSKRLIMLGAGGHAKVLYALMENSDLELGGVSDPNGAGSFSSMALELIEHESDLDPCEHALINGLGSIPGNQNLRIDLFNEYYGKGFRFPNLIDSTAIVRESIPEDIGIQIIAGSTVQPGVSFGNNVIINTMASVDHDCVIESNVHLAPGATLSGNVTVRQNAHIGTNSTVIQGIEIGSGAIIGAGAVITKNVLPGEMVLPARSTRRDAYRGT